MRVGLFARANDRGLGIQSWEVARHLDCKTIVIDAGKGDVCHPRRFPGALLLPWQGGIHRRTIEDWLEGVDVCYSAETFYSKMIVDWAGALGIDTVCHVNPEFFTRAQAASVYWSATPWRREHLPAELQVVPYPVATDRWPSPVDEHTGPCRWLHVAGRETVADRNGTLAVLEALGHLKHRANVTIVVQDSRPLPGITMLPHVKVERVGAAIDYWKMYEGFDALVMPRRFGGLCLPVQEAMGAGLGVLMTDVSPNTESWPVATVATSPGETVSMPVGEVEIAAVDPVELAAAMDLFADTEYRHTYQRAARRWAAAHSWDVWGPRWLDLMAHKEPAWI